MSTFKDAATALAAAQVLRIAAAWGGVVAVAVAAGTALLLAVAGCAVHPGSSAAIAPSLQQADLTNPAQPAFSAGPISLAGARGEDISFAVQTAAEAGSSLQLSAWTGPASANPTPTAYAVLPVPVDLNHAVAARMMGPVRLESDAATPRVLLPLAMRGGQVLLPSRRSPQLVWFDLHIPSDLPAGSYQSTCTLLDGRGNSAAALPIDLEVNGLILPATPSLAVTSPLSWRALSQLWPEPFAGIVPRLLNRTDPQCSAAVGVLDRLMSLARANRVAAFVPELQPTAKWPPSGSPQIDWSDFDSVVLPWLGSPQNDGAVAPLPFWPLPSAQSLAEFDLPSQQDYWRLAAAHFRQRSWLKRSPVMLDQADPSLVPRVKAALSSDAAVHVQLGMDAASVRAVWRNGPLQRISPAAPGWVVRAADDGSGEATPWLGWTGRSGMPPAGMDESDARAAGWLAWLRHASPLVWREALPKQSRADQPIGIEQSPWFYPGSWFGVDQPVATLQLKWARRAEQDYEYLMLASRRGQGGAAERIARLLVKPIDASGATSPDMALQTACGTASRVAWQTGLQLLAQPIPLAPSMPQRFSTDRWLAERQRPALLLNRVDWSVDGSARASVGALHARVGLTVLDPTAQPAAPDLLQWATTPPGWQVGTEPLSLAVPRPTLAGLRPAEAELDGTFDVQSSTAGGSAEGALSLLLSSGASGQMSAATLSLPIATSLRRSRPVNLDGSLSDWYPDDALHLNRPLVPLLNRPTVQQGTFEAPQGPPASIYSSWSDDALNVAFRLEEVAPLGSAPTRNFVRYDQGRAWGEDLVELLIQPVDGGHLPAPLLHVVLKPGGEWVEREQPGSQLAWQAFEGAGIAYAATVDAQQRVWRGEVQIPWSAITAPGGQRPALVRFNFVQHNHSTGQSGSWAGPTDDGRDGRIMGILALRPWQETAAGDGTPALNGH